LSGKTAGCSGGWLQRPPVRVDSMLIDQAKFGEALRQGRASNFDLPVPLGLQPADLTRHIPGCDATPAH
jgi:hypothetical protein